MATATTLIGAYVDQKKRDGLRESSIKAYFMHAKTFLNIVGIGISSTVEQFRALDDEVFHKYLDKRDGSTHNSLLIELNALRKFAGMKPLDRKVRKVIEKEAIDLDDAENVYQKMMAACRDDRERAILVLMRHGGLREGEVVLLEAENFKFLADHVKLHFYRPKTSTWGDVAITEGVRYIDVFVKGKTGRLFNVDVKQIWRIVHDVSIRAGVKWNPHKFRAFRATELGGNGAFTKWDLDNIFGWKRNGNTAGYYVRVGADESNKKLLKVAGAGPKEEPAEIKKLRCRRCAAVLGKDEIATGRCPVCDASTNPADAVAELKSREDLESQVAQMQANMAAMRQELKAFARRLIQDPNAEF